MEGLASAALGAQAEFSARKGKQNLSILDIDF
jgi:hypothetical protein